MFRKRKPEPQALQAAKAAVKLTAAEKREISRILETARGDGKVHSAQDTFPVGGDVILIENDRLAEALNALPQDGRNILLMYFFLDMADREIAERMHVARRTVNARRQKAYRLLKELMGGDVDD